MSVKAGRLMNPATGLSIVIPTFNGVALLRRCLQTVERYRPADSEVIVVDDGSTDSTSDQVRLHFPTVRLVRLAGNSGFCRAANAGLEAANGRFVELLNNDTEVCAEWADAALAEFADPTVGAVAPLVCKLPYRRRIDSAGDRYYWYGRAKKRGEGQPRSAPFDQPAEVFAASASSAFYRTDLLRKIGGFPEHFGAYLDDVDVGFRIRLAGYRCVFCPPSRVLHWVSRSHSIKSRRLLQQISRNSERVFWANLRPGQLAWRAAPHLAFVLIELAYKSLRGDFSPWFAGKCAVLSELPRLWRQRRVAQSLTNTPD